MGIATVASWIGPLYKELGSGWTFFLQREPFNSLQFQSVTTNACYKVRDCWQNFREDFSGSFFFLSAWKWASEFATFIRQCTRYSETGQPRGTWRFKIPIRVSAGTGGWRVNHKKKLNTKFENKFWIYFLLVLCQIKNNTTLFSLLVAYPGTFALVASDSNQP